MLWPKATEGGTPSDYEELCWREAGQCYAHATACERNLVRAVRGMAKLLLAAPLLQVQ